MNSFGKIVLNIVLVIALTQAIFGAVYTVTKVADTNDGTCDSDCSLREAVVAANATADNDTIIFSSLFNTPETITLGGSEIVFANNGSLTIFGTGADKITISGNNASRIFVSGANVVVNLHNLRFTGGTGVGAVNTGRGGAIYNVGGTMTITNSVFTGNTAANGGAMNNSASTGPAVPANLTIVNCSFTNNSSTSSGMALQNFSTSFLNIRNTTISNNTTTATGIAGAIQANGTVTIANSTISGNTAAAGTGAGVYFNGTSLNMTNNTIVNNTSGVGGGGLHRTGATPLIIRNTIIANNTGVAASPDAFGAVNSEGTNIIGNNTGSSGWIASDLQNTNPILSPLGFYGGVGLTHALLTSSPALNGGQNCVIDLSCSANNPSVAIANDQRGANRANVDIGAFEGSNDFRAILPVATNNQPYSQILTSNVGSFSYFQAGGTLPSGVTVNTGGIIANVSGTPTQAGMFDFFVSITGTNSAIVWYRLYVSPATTSVFGRIVSPNGALSSKVTVLLTSNSGNTIRTTTNPFGYYRFDNVNVGQVYQVSAASKIFTFVNNPQFVLVNDSVTAPDITVAP